MPRSNRPNRRRASGSDDDDDFSRALIGRRHTEQKHEGLWNVQPLAAASAAKNYTCPSCGLDIPPGMAHVVSWRADGMMGEADDLAARRHWHSHCWKIKP